MMSRRGRRRGSRKEEQKRFGQEEEEQKGGGGREGGAEGVGRRGEGDDGDVCRRKKRCSRKGEKKGKR